MLSIESKPDLILTYCFDAPGESVIRYGRRVLASFLDLISKTMISHGVAICQ